MLYSSFRKQEFSRFSFSRHMNLFISSHHPPCLAVGISVAPPEQKWLACLWAKRQCFLPGSCSSAGRCRSSHCWSWSSGRPPRHGASPPHTAGLHTHTHTHTHTFSTAAVTPIRIRSLETQDHSGRLQPARNFVFPSMFMKRRKTTFTKRQPPQMLHLNTRTVNEGVLQC